MMERKKRGFCLRGQSVCAKMSPPRKVAKLSKENDEDFWKGVFKIFVKKIMQNPNQIKDELKCLLHKLLTNGCKSNSIVSKILEMYSQCHWVDSSCAPYILKIAVTNIQHILGDRYCELPNYTNYGYLKSSVFFIAIDKYNYRFICALTKYGFYFNGKDAVHEEDRKIFILKRFFMYFRNGANSQIIAGRAEQAMEDLKQRNGRMLSEAERGFHRCIFMIVMLKAMLIRWGEKGHSTYGYVRCVKLLLDSTTEPLVSVEEFEDFLQFLQLTYIKRDLNVEKYTDTFKQIFCHYYTKLYSPRSLKHLCRCEVRKINMDKASPLPCLVEDMDIPESLKTYLLVTPKFLN